MQSLNTYPKTNDASIELLNDNSRGQEYIGKVKSTEDVGHSAFNVWVGAAKDKTTRMVLFFIHDIYDSSSRYQNCFNYIKEHYQGPLTLVSIDLVGMGMSSGHRGYVSNFDHYCLDSIAIINNVLAAQNETVLTAMMGVGLGGLVNLRILEQFSHLLPKSFDGILLVNPLIRPTFKIPSVLADSFLKYMPRMDRRRFNLPYHGIDICDSLTYAAHFDADVTNQKFMTLAKAREILQTSSKVRAAAYFINTPTLILSSESPLNDHEAIGLFHKGLNTKESRHIFFKFCTHDLLNGRRQNKAFKLILNWLNTGYTNDIN